MNMVYGGTTVTYGRGRAARGRHREQHGVRRHRPDADDDRAVRRPPCRSASTGWLSSWRAFSLVLVAVVVALGLLRGRALPRHAALRRCGGGRRRSGGAPRRRDDLAHARGPAHGQAARPHPAPAGDGDARERLGHLLGQDRHADQGPDDRAHGLRGRADAGRVGRRLRARRAATLGTARTSSLPHASAGGAARRRRSHPTRTSCGTRATSTGTSAGIRRRGRWWSPPPRPACTGRTSRPSSRAWRRSRSPPDTMRMTTLHEAPDGTRRVREGRARGDPRVLHAAAGRHGRDRA